MKKRGRKVGYRKPEPRIKSTITLPQFWWDWLREQKRLTEFSQSQMVQRALEDLRHKIDKVE